MSRTVRREADGETPSAILTKMAGALLFLFGHPCDLLIEYLHTSTADIKKTIIHRIGFCYFIFVPVPVIDFGARERFFVKRNHAQS